MVARKRRLIGQVRSCSYFSGESETGWSAALHPPRTVRRWGPRRERAALFLQLCDQRFGLRGIGAVRRQLQVRLELGDGLGEIAFVHERHAQLVMRFCVV